MSRFGIKTIKYFSHTCRVLY